MDSYGNFIISDVAVAPSPQDTGTTLEINPSDEAAFSDLIDLGEADAVVWPAGVEPRRTNAEIVRITGYTGAQLTIVREQQNTTARNIDVGWNIMVGLTAKTLDDILNLISVKANTADLGAAAFTNSYNDLDDLPTIPTALSDLTGTLDDIANGTTYVKSENNYDDAAVSKLAGIAAGATVYTDEMAQDAIGSSLVTQSDSISWYYDDAGNALYANVETDNSTLEVDTSGNVVRVKDLGISTGKIANDAVTYAKMQNVSATDKVLGRSSSGSGDVEEITMTAAGRALMDDANAAAQLVTLGLSALAAQIDSVLNAWLPSSDTWSYSSVDDPTGVITINSVDRSSVYKRGTKIKFVNGGNTIYGIVCEDSTFSTNTTIKFTHEIDPTDGLGKTLMANSAITSNYYSYAKAPAGFPMAQESWTYWVQDSSSRTQSSPTDNVVYNPNSNSIAVPIGQWAVGFYVVVDGNRASSGAVEVDVALSTANNSMSDNLLKDKFLSNGSVRNLRTANRERELTLSAKTTYYLVGSAISSLSDFKFRGDLEPSRMYARCTLL